MAGDPWSVNYGMVHTGENGIPEYGGAGSSANCLEYRAGIAESDRSESLGQVPFAPASAVWQNWHVGEFSLFQDPNDARTALVSSRDSAVCMHVYRVCIGAEVCFLSLSWLTQFPRTLEWTVGSYPGFCSVSSTGTTIPANDILGMAVVV